MRLNSRNFVVCFAYFDDTYCHCVPELVSGEVISVGLLSPIWGVGRLHLSSKGCREPHTDKCDDLRLFCIHTKSVLSSTIIGGKTKEFKFELKGEST